MSSYAPRSTQIVATLTAIAWALEAWHLHLANKPATRKES